jgi:hypothetical protein
LSGCCAVPAVGTPLDGLLSVMNQPSMLLLSAVAVSSMGAFAQHALATRQGVGAVPSSATQSVAQSSTTLSLRGIIDKYDAASRTLSLSTSSGPVQFSVASTTRIRRGWYKLDASELPKFTGDRATVRYTESSGNKIVESIHLFEK